MAFWNKKKKDEEESNKPSSSTDSAPTSRAARALRDLFNATVQGQQKAVQADQTVARETNRQVTTAARNIIDSTTRGQQAATRADQAVAGAQNKKLADAAAGLYSAYQQQQERAAREQMARQSAQMQAPTQRAQDAAAGLYSAYLNQQESLADIQRRQNQSQAETMAGLYANAADSLRGANELYQKQLAGTDTGNRANELMTQPVLQRANQRQSSLVTGDPKKGAGKYIKYLNAADFAVNSLAREDNKDATYNYINNLNGERERQQGYAMQRGADSGMEKYQLMTDEERGVYNYLYNTQGKTAANGFLARIDAELNEQYYSGQSKYQTELANQDTGSRLAFSAATVAQQPVRTLGSAAALVEDVIRADSGEGIDPYSEFRRASMLAQDVRGSIAEYYDQQYPGGFLGMTAGDVYNTVMSAADSAMNMAVAGYAGQAAGAIRGLENIDKVMSFTNQLGSAMMSSEVAATAIAESKKKGYSDVGALSLGMIRGGIEYLSEKIGGDWIISRMKKNPLNAFKTIAMAMIPEGVEEVMSDIGNEIVNMLVDDAYGTDESYVLQAHKQFEQQGSENPWADTLGVILKQEWKSFAGGALSALGSGGTFYVQNRGAINQAANQLNTDAKTVVQLMDELETENPDEVRLLAELFDLKSADDMRDKIRELTDAEAAIDQRMQEQEAEETAPTERAEEAARTMKGNESAPTEGRGAVTDVDTEGVFDNAEQSDNRGQQNGNDALGTGGADLIYEAGTQRSRVDAGDESRQRFDRVQNYAVKEEVTPAQLGIANGSTTQRVQVLDESSFEPGSPEAMAIQSAREAGLDPVIIRGTMDIGGKQARAFISGNRVILQADAKVGADKLLKHERYHREARRNPRLNDTLRRAVAERMTEQQMTDLISRYITAYDGVYDFSQMTQEDIERICEEELFADLDAGIDNSGRTDLREAAQQGFDEAQSNEQNVEADQDTTGPPEGRAAIAVDSDISNTVDNALNNTGSRGANEIGQISSAENRAINRFVNGRNDAYRGKFTGGKHVITNDAIRHSISEHGDVVREALRAQLPLTADDIKQALSAIKNGQARVTAPSTTERGTPSIIQTIPVNGYTLYAEEISHLSKDKPADLIGHTMWKAPTLATAAARGTSPSALPKRQRSVLSSYSITQNGKKSTRTFVTDSEGNAVPLFYEEYNGTPVRENTYAGIIFMSADNSVVAQKSSLGGVNSGYVLMTNPFIITEDNAVFKNSDEAVSRIVADLRRQGYDGLIFDYHDGDRYAVMVFNDGQIVSPTDFSSYTKEEGRASVDVPGDTTAKTGDIRRQLADAEREYMEHSDANDAEYDYRAQLEKINDLRRQIEEAESVNAEADNVNAETDTNPAIEAMEREGRVSRGTYDVEKYGDTHPERGEVGRDGVRMCNTTADLEAELNEIGGARIRNDTGEYFARIRRKNDNGYLLTINRDGKRDTSRSFADYKEASAYAASYIEGQTQARTDAELDNEKSAPVPRQEPIEAMTTGQVQDEAKRQKQNKAAEASTQSLRDRIRKTDEEIKALRRLEKTTGLTELQAQHKADLQETLEILNDELTSRKGRAKAKKEKVEVKGNKPVRSAAEAKNRLMEIFHTAAGQKADTGTKLEAKLAEIVSSGKITEQNREDILDMLIDAGMVRQEAEQEYRDVRDWLRGSRIYVSEHDRADFGDDWEGIRKSAWANGIYLTSNESDRSVDSLVSELAETFGTNMFPTDDAPSDMVRNLIEQAEKGRSSMITFAEAVNNEARMEHVDPQEIWNDLSRQADETLRAFAEKAKLEMDLKDRTASMLATERKRAEDRMERMAQRRRESEIREKTFKAIRRLKKLRGKAAADVKTQIDEAIRDIDTQARQLTINGLEDLQELARVYEDAKKAAGYVDEENPGNFLKNPYIEERLNRLTQKHINEMDIDDVIELGRVVAALENTVKTNGKMIGEQFDSEVKTVADKVNAEVQSSRGAKPGFLQKWFAEEQLSPRRFLELLGGWKKGAMAGLADSLEKGQTKMLDFQRRAAQLMDPFMSKKENRKWLKTASGKNAKWYTYSVANGLDTEGGGITGQTIEITPMMKVSLYLASLNEDNLRHIQTGGLVIPDKALYMKGKTQEAFAQGKRVKMQPEAVRHIAASLTQEEKTFAGYLQKFFNTMSKDAINEVSVQLDGFERADVEQYFPIESSRAFLKSDVSGEARAQTVEGIGSIANERVHASNPIVLDDAYNVFMRQVDKVSRYYGYAIPIRNFQAVNNFVFHEEGNAFAGSIKDTINRKWGAGAENYITKMLADIQGASSKGDMTSRFLSMLRGNLAGATLAVNPSVAVSQTASYPGAAQAVGWDGLAAGLVSGPVDEKLIEKYTPLLWYRSQGYSTQEIGDAVSAQNKSLAQKALASKALNWIQTMDRLAVKRIWKAAEYRVTKDTGLKPGSKALIDSGMDPYYQKVAEVFNRAVYDTQPNYTDMERAQILRSDSDITKFLTMYKTVPLQYYGMTAEAVGRMQAALKSGNKTEIRAARKYAADTFGGLLAANSVYVIMKALFKSFRGKDKDYRDEEGEITPESYFKQLGKDLAETYAGSIIGGAEAYSLITGWINGDKFRAPEINVLSSVEDIANGFQSIFKAIDDDDPGKTAKAVKDAAENIAMVCGLPVKNVETYLMAAIRYIQPQTAMQYDSFFGGLNKGDLRGMDSDTIGSAASIIMNSRTGANMERAATDELSRLYAAGFTDAIPTAIPDSFEYAGNTVKIKDRGAYRETWGGTVGDNLEELTANESYINADDKTKEAMIRKLYQYATVQARMGADPEYTVEGNSTYGWTEKADAAMESGMDLPTVIAAMTTMNAMTADKVNGQTVKSKKSKIVEYIDGLKLDTEQKDALYELAGYESGLEKAPWHSGISAETGYATGTNKPVINEAARKRAVEANYQQLTSSAAYKAADDQTKKAMIEKLNQYAEVQGMVTTDPDYLPTGTAGWTIWAETAEKAGIDLISAIDYATQLDSFKADYNEYGKAISGSKKDKVTKYIDALDLTNEQKDILYLKIYAENSLKYTPWHGYTGKKKKRRGGGRRGSGKKSTAAKKPVSVGKITPKYSTGIDISTLFPTTGSSGRSGTGKTTGLSTDLAKIVNSGLDISELFKLPTTGTKAPKGRTRVDFRI